MPATSVELGFMGKRYRTLSLRLQVCVQLPTNELIADRSLDHTGAPVMPWKFTHLHMIFRLMYSVLPCRHNTAGLHHALRVPNSPARCNTAQDHSVFRGPYTAQFPKWELYVLCADIPPNTLVCYFTKLLGLLMIKVFFFQLVNGINIIMFSRVVFHVSSFRYTPVGLRLWSWFSHHTGFYPFHKIQVTHRCVQHCQVSLTLRVVLVGLRITFSNLLNTPVDLLVHVIMQFLNPSTKNILNTLRPILCCRCLWRIPHCADTACGSDRLQPLWTHHRCSPVWLGRAGGGCVAVAVFEQRVVCMCMTPQVTRSD